MRRPIDEVIDHVLSGLPSVVVERLQVTHLGADDDNVWFFGLPDRRRDVQVGSNPGGEPPFLVEGPEAGERAEVVDPAHAAGLVLRWLARP